MNYKAKLQAKIATENYQSLWAQIANPRYRITLTLRSHSYECLFGNYKLNFELYKKEIMNALENIKNSLIDSILATKNERLLEAIKSILIQHN